MWLYLKDNRADVNQRHQIQNTNLVTNIFSEIQAIKIPLVSDLIKYINDQTTLELILI